MSAAAHLLRHLHSLGIRLAASGGRLRVNAVRGGLTEDVRQAITSSKTELLELLTPPARAPGTLPLSAFQRRLWVLHRLDPASTAYNMAAIWPGADAVDAAQLAQAIGLVVARHDILRTVFQDGGTEPHARILPPEAVSIVQEDLAGLDPAAQQEAMGKALRGATSRPFALATEAPVRWTVFQLSTGRAATLIAAHHIALDAWSFDLLRREVAATALDPAPRPVPALQFTDHVAAQPALDDGRAAAELAWWETRLAGLPPRCTFAADQPAHMAAGSSAPAGPAGSFHPFCWDTDLSDAIRGLATRTGCTLYMMLLAACAVVLRAHTARNQPIPGDVVLGSPMGLREQPELETVLGPFVNLLVLRLDLRDDPAFATLLARTREAVLDAHEHRHVAFETLVERLNPVRSLDRAPLFQVAVVLHPDADPAGVPIYSGGAIQDLTWFVREVAGRIDGSLEYRTDLFSARMVDRIAGQLENVLRAAVRDPAQRVGVLPLLKDAERQHILDAFNPPEVPLDQAPFPLQFEHRAASQPGSCAVCFGDLSMSYAALNRRANQIAHQLRAFGIGPGSLVGVCLPRSPDLLAALLGVLKAGAAYVPLDPLFPAGRLAFMLDHSGVGAVIVADGAVGLPPLPDGVRLFDLTAEAALLEGRPADNPTVSPLPADPAYVIYTSGSTGQPKGVVVAHGALSNLLGAMRRLPPLDSPATLAALTTVSFDIAALELFMPLVTGGTIALAPRETAADGAALARFLAATGATVVQATPATWRLLLAAGWQGGEHLVALCGGEAMSRDLADILLPRVGALWNLYGPTETTIWSTAARVAHDTAPVSLGRPLANTRVYVLDPAGAPTPVGIAGEICIGGAGVALGYHRQAALTTERFVPDLFASPPGARLFRTGDLGLWRDDETLVHLGRLDRQTKIRGFRIEPEEIEAALRRHVAVAAAAVTASAVGEDDSRLIAYVVYHPGEDATASELRAHLRQTLPDYMVPALFLPLDAVPMTPNGKLDLGSLPDPFGQVSRAERRQTPPAPGLEQAVASIWQDLLRIDQVSAEDNFFELGGHSLLSLRVAAAVERETGLILPPRALFFQNLRQVAAGLGAEAGRDP